MLKLLTMNIVQTGQKPGLSLSAHGHSVKQMAGDYLWSSEWAFRQ
jgi:hypothetical protein